MYIGMLTITSVSCAHPTHMHNVQATLQILQCVVLGDLVQYFSIEDPTGEETRNVYIYATGLSHSHMISTCTIWFHCTFSYCECVNGHGYWKFIGERETNLILMCYLSVLVVTALLGAVNYAHASLFSCKNAMILKVLLTAALYHKVRTMKCSSSLCIKVMHNLGLKSHLCLQALCLDPMSLQDVSIGHVITLASNDVQRFDWVCDFHMNFVTTV